MSLMDKNKDIKLVAIVGMCGSGKSTAVDYLTERNIPKIYFGGVVLNAVKEAGLEELLVLTKVDGYAKISAALEKGRAESYLQVAFCVGMLCVFGLGMLIVMLNVANSKDYAIHRLVGATKRDVALMTTVQMLILLLVSDVLIHYPYLLSKTGLFLNGDSMLYIFSGERKIYIVIAVLNISVLLLTYIISRVYTAKNDVSATIKDKE